jgi:hypothetical protein
LSILGLVRFHTWDEECGILKWQSSALESSLI